ncbi:All3226 protein [Candidatus Moduliflexus flocculans]|uniref:All3226 protein n=1 Tax=Candidatus Moduliflexus flocculans TaxID=1499966 RepID=A0A0S6W184_9BACT|nr:All3226 protein [Candidatus Moduliflexus flocculans]
MAGTRCALLIGNNAYCDAEFPPLTKPARDVADFAALLRDPRIGAFDEVTEYVDRSWHEVQRDISRFFRQRHKDDLLLLYFSGHGYRELSGEFYLVFDDTTFDDLDASAISAHFVRKQIDRSGAERKVVILDCCHSAAFFGEKGTNSGAEDAVSAFEGNGSGKIILAASHALQKAQEKTPDDMATPYSLFTHFLIEGLRTGRADLDEDGKIGAEELFEFASAEMQAIHAAQTPKKFVAAHGEIVVAKNPCWIPRSDRSLLPRWLLNRLDEDDSSDRFRAIDDLVSIIQRHDERCAMAALTELRRLSLEDRAPRVRRAAEGALEELDEPESRDVPHVVEEIIELRDDEYELIEESNEPSAGDLWREPVTGMEFVYIPAGQFMMGSPESEEGRYDDESPLHKVSLAEGFWMGKYPVTQAEWQKIMGNNPSHFKGERRPVETVSWNDAQEFLQKLNATVGAGSEPAPTFRLPSEAEWEYACRAGTTTPFSFGETISTDQANYNGNYIYGSGKKGVYREQTTDVGSFPPNAFGVYDMHGNVWEWCQDSYASYSETPTDGSAYGSLGDGKTKLLRGGSWLNQPSYARSAARLRLEPGFQDFYFGFRVVVVR